MFQVKFAGLCFPPADVNREQTCLLRQSDFKAGSVLSCEWHLTGELCVRGGLATSSGDKCRQQKMYNDPRRSTPFLVPDNLWWLSGIKQCFL